jgi:protein gp37
MRSKQDNPKISEKYDGVLTPQGKWNGKIRMREDNLDLPLMIKKPTVFAVWNDLFHESVDCRFINKAWMNVKLVKMPNLGGRVWDQFPEVKNAL